MTDNTELKRAASASKNWGGEVGEGRWYAAECFKRPYFSAQDAEFIAACDPGRVLALIAQIEQDETHLRAFSSVAETAIAERDQLKAENEALRKVMSAVVAEIPGAQISRAGNAPVHCHSVPGVWDRDNGAKAGKECAWCKVWNYAAAMGKGEQS